MSREISCLSIGNLTAPGCCLKIAGITKVSNQRHASALVRNGGEYAGAGSQVQFMARSWIEVSMATLRGTHCCLEICMEHEAVYLHNLKFSWVSQPWSVGSLTSTRE